MENIFWSNKQRFCPFKLSSLFASYRKFPVVNLITSLHRLKYNKIFIEFIHRCICGRERKWPWGNLNLLPSHECALHSRVALHALNLNYVWICRECRTRLRPLRGRIQITQLFKDRARELGSSGRLAPDADGLACRCHHILPEWYEDGGGRVHDNHVRDEANPHSFSGALNHFAHDQIEGMRWQSLLD